MRRCLPLVAPIFCSLVGCQIIIGVDDTRERRPDAGTTPDAAGPGPDAGPIVVAAVRAEGIVAPVQVRLQAGDTEETATVSTDGTVAFAAPVANGGNYTVSLVGGPPCALGANASGTATADVLVDLACIGATRLTGLVVESITGTQPVLADNTQGYLMTVSELQQMTQVTATPRSSAARLTIQGMAVENGIRSAPIGLAHGSNTITIEVEHPLSAALRTLYTVNVNRLTTTAHVARYKQFSQATDFMGWDLASDQRSTIVGAAREGSVNDPGGAANLAPSSGAAYIYRHDGNNLVYEDFLKAPNAQGVNGNEDGDIFGWAVAIDGDVAVVSAIFEDSGSAADPLNNGVKDSGAVYVFRRVVTGGNVDWLFEQYLKSPYPKVNGYFGWSLDVDGDTIVVGAYNEDAHDAGGNIIASASGQIHVFERGGGNWVLTASLEGETNAGSDHLGHAVDIDGNTIVGGAIGGNPTVGGAGAAFVFVRGVAGWTQQATLVAPMAGDNYASNFFAGALALDGDTAAIGMSEPITGGNVTSTAPGAMFVFTRNGTAWSSGIKLTASNGDPDDEFGRTVALAGDLLAVGAPNEDGAGVGVTDPAASDTAQTENGATYLYRRTGSSWTQVRYVKPQPGTSTAGSGQALVLLPSGLLLVGGPGDDVTAANSGAVWLLQ